ncbi:hypothetical protein DMC47_36890 [Nostoc sp. 3335mG]|nr:hypothetical protein DMC47_36890 [Nostoc sp. 3335mG]
MSAGPAEHWRHALGEGRLLLQRAKSSGTVIFPPRLMEPGVGDTDLEWIEASGMGTVYAATVISRKPPEPAYNVVLVDLDEHVRLMSRVDGIAAEAVKIGMRVRAKVLTEGDEPLLVFEAV